MTQSYLDKYRSTIPSTQGDQIFKRLMKEKESGEINSIDEFRERMRKLTSKLLEEKIAPTLQAIEEQTGEPISSEVWNDVLDNLENDLTTAFKEAVNIDDILTTHNKIILEIAAKSVYRAINHIEAQVELYEYLNNNDYGFDDSLYNTFRDLRGETARGEETNALFIDPKADPANAEMEEDEDAQIDLEGDRLVLGEDKHEEAPVRLVEFLTNENSHHSELNIEGELSNLNNIIDQKNSTHWIYPILLTSQDNNVQVRLLFDFGMIRNINKIVVEPATDIPLDLTRIEKVYGDGRRVDVVTDFFKVIDGVATVTFDTIITRYIALTFRQTNCHVTQFKKRVGDRIAQLAATDHNNISGTVQDISQELSDAVTSRDLLENIIGLVDEDEEVVSYYQYIFGLDNVRFYNEEYHEKSLFISKKKKAKLPGELGLRVTEERPSQTSGNNEISYAEFDWSLTSNFHHAVTEYWVYSEFYSEDDTLLGSYVLPVFPLEATRVEHEKLIFVKKSSSTLSFMNLSSTQFYCDEDTSDVIVYKNGKQLDTSEWAFATSDPDIHVEEPNQGSRMKTGIQILNRDNPLDIYTISYTPKTSNVHTPVSSSYSLANVIDLSGDKTAILAPNGVIRIAESLGSSKIAYGNFYLMILMRRNSAQKTRTPAVKDYMLLTGSRNVEKFK